MNFFQKPKILTVTIIILFILNVGTIGFLIFHRPPRPLKEFDHHEKMEQREMMPPPDARGFLEEQLNFNDKQKEEFSKMRDEHHKQISDIQDSIKNVKDKLFAQVSTNPINEAEINSLCTAIGEFQKRIELTTFYHFQKVRMLCDDTQKQKFDLIIKDAIKMIDMRGPQMPPGNQMPPPGHEHRLPPPPIR